MLKQLAMVAVAVIIALSAVSIATADGNSNSLTSTNSVTVGNYLLENTTTTGSFNLSYVNDNAHILVANSVNATGQSVSTTSTKLFNADNTHTLGNNLTVFTAGSEKTLILATQGLTAGVTPSITLNLTSPVSSVMLNQMQNSFLSEHSSSLVSTFFANKVYTVTVDNMSFMLFSTVKANLSDSNQTLTYSGQNSLTGNIYVGLVSTSALQDSFEKQLSDHRNAFIYNNTTGAVSGKFLSFNFNDTTGVFTNYTSNETGNSIFTSMEASGNGTIGLDNPNPMFPTVSPVLTGNLFFYGNNTVVYQIHDNPSLVNNIYLSNGTLNLSVAKGLNVTIYRPQVSDVQHENLSGNLNYTGVSLGDQFDVEASSTIVLLHNSTFRASLFAHHATVSYNNTTGQLSLTTNDNAKITFVAPPGFQQINHHIANVIQYAVEHGKLAAMVVLGAPGINNSNMSVSYNSTMNINIQNVNTNSVTIKVGSKSSHEGTNFGIFVPNGVIANNSKIVVTFDSKNTVTVSNISSVINATSNTQASIYKVSVNGGTLIVIHVPHFSNHTIQISAVNSQAGLPGLPGNDSLYVLGGAVVVVALVGIGLATRKRK
jgi:hypothetical protein